MPAEKNPDFFGIPNKPKETNHQKLSLKQVQTFQKSQTFSSLVSLQVKNVTKGFDSVKMHSDSVIVPLKCF